MNDEGPYVVMNDFGVKYGNRSLNSELRPIHGRRGKMRFVNMREQDPVQHFDSLLEWLDPDRERASEKYLGLRKSLIKIFTWQGCADAEFLANETVDRVMSRVSELRRTYKGDPNLYFYAVAKKLLNEQRHARFHNAELPDSIPANQTTDFDQDRNYTCMEQCLAQLSPSSRALILDYYSQEPMQMHLHRKELAESLQIAPGQLRVQVFRIRNQLQRCLEACMKQEAES